MPNVLNFQKSDFDDSSGLSGVTSGKDHLSCLSGRRGKYIPTRPNAASVTHERRGSKGSAER